MQRSVGVEAMGNAKGARNEGKERGEGGEGEGEDEGEGEGEGKTTCGDQSRSVALSSSPLHVSCTPPSTGCFDSSLLSFPSLLHFRHFTPHSSQHGSVPSHRFGSFLSLPRRAFSANHHLSQPHISPPHSPALSSGLHLRLVRNSVVLSNVVGSFIGCQTCALCLSHGCCNTARWTDLLSCFDSSQTYQHSCQP